MQSEKRGCWQLQIPNITGYDIERFEGCITKTAEVLPGSRDLKIAGPIPATEQIPEITG